MTAINTRWKFSEQPDSAVRGSLADALHIPEALAALLIQRGYRSVEDAKRFLRPTLDSLSDPYQFKDLPEATSLISTEIVL